MIRTSREPVNSGPTGCRRRRARTPDAVRAPDAPRPRHATGAPPRRHETDPPPRRNGRSSAGRRGCCKAGSNTSSSKRWWYSRITEICNSSREPKCAKTPDLLICMTSAKAPMLKPSKPIWVARPKAASTMAALVCWPLCTPRCLGASPSASETGWMLELTGCPKKNDRAILHDFGLP